MTRLFFALPLPDNIQRQLIHWRAAHFATDAGRPVVAANLHLTLAFLGETGENTRRTLIAQAARIRQPGFTLTLDDAGQWLRPGIVWLGARQPPRGLLQLAALLRAQAARCGCYQSPQPFHPHITLLRQTRDAVPIPAPGFCWQFSVREFVLYASSTDRGRTQYRPLQRFTLTEEI